MISANLLVGAAFAATPAYYEEISRFVSQSEQGRIQSGTFLINQSPFLNIVQLSLERFSSLQELALFSMASSSKYCLSTWHSFLL
jgi:hypothetical protein